MPKLPNALLIIRRVKAKEEGGQELPKLVLLTGTTTLAVFAILLSVVEVLFTVVIAAHVFVVKLRVLVCNRTLLVNPVVEVWGMV